MVAPFLAADLLHDKGPWFDEIIEPNKFVPERKYDKVYDLDITRTGRSAIFKPEMDYFDIFEATYDVSFGDRKKLPEILKLETIDAEKKAVDDLIEHHRSDQPDSKNIVLHTTSTSRTSKKKRTHQIIDHTRFCYKNHLKFYICFTVSAGNGDY